MKIMNNNSVGNKQFFDKPRELLPRKRTTSQFHSRRVHRVKRQRNYIESLRNPIETCRGKTYQDPLRRIKLPISVLNNKIKSKDQCTQLDVQRGVAQCAFSMSLKKNTKYPKKELTYKEFELLDLVLPTLAPTEFWTFQSLSMVFNGLSAAKVFSSRAPHGAQLTFNQTDLLSQLLQHIASRCAEAKSSDDLASRWIANVFWAVTQLTRQCEDIETVPHLEATVISLMPYVEFYAFWYETFNSQDIATVLYAFDELTEKGLQLEPLKNPTEALMLGIVNMTKRTTFPQKDVPNMLKPMAKLVEKKVISIDDCHDALYVILHRVRELTENSDKSAEFTRKEIANVMWPIGKLVEHGMALSQELKETVTALLPRITTMAKSENDKDHFIPQDLSMLMWSIGALVSKGFELNEPVEEAVNSLSHCITEMVNAKGERGNFIERSAYSIIWSLSKLQERGMVLTSAVQDSVLALLPCIDEIMRSSGFVNSRTIYNLIRCLSLLVDHKLECSNRLRNTSNLLLRHIDSAKLSNCTDEQDVISLLNSIRRFGGKKLLMSNVAKDAANALVDNILAVKYHFENFQLGNLLLVIGALGEAIELERAKSVFDFLIDQVKSTGTFTTDDGLHILNGLLMHRARLYLASEMDSYRSLEALMEQLFEDIKNNTIYSENGHSIMIMAASWLRRPYPVKLSRYFSESKSQTKIKNMLEEYFPSLKIEEEKVLHNLTPVDLFLPNSNTCIEIQGPYHYLGDDQIFKNGKTLRKMALLKKRGYSVIEIPLHLINYPEFREKIINEIKNRESKK